MKTYLISYDLLKSETSSDYEKLINSIKSCENWAKPLESLWLIKTTLDSVQIRDILTKDMDNDDKLLVIEVTNNWASFNLKKPVVEWMQWWL